jgi:UDP-N-acetylglucosamine transferase subunit ALG13
MVEAKNFTFLYHPREDRIILILNHNDYQKRVDFFITRKKTIHLLSDFDEILLNHCQKGEILSKILKNQKPLIEKKGNKKIIQKNKWEEIVDKKELEFTKKNKPILLDAISISFAPDFMTLKFISQKNTFAFAKMNCILFQQTLSSFYRVVPFLEWGISPAIFSCLKKI